MESGAVHPMDSKRSLAREIVERYYDGKTAKGAEEHFNKLFSERKSLEELADDEMIDFWKISEPTPLFKVVSSLRNTSTSEAIRLIKGGAVRVMEDKVVDTGYLVTPGKDKVIKVGKKFFRIWDSKEY